MKVKGILAASLVSSAIALSGCASMGGNSPMAAQMKVMKEEQADSANFVSVYQNKAYRTKDNYLAVPVSVTAVSSNSIEQHDTNTAATAVGSYFGTAASIAGWLIDNKVRKQKTETIATLTTIHLTTADGKTLVVQQPPGKEYPHGFKVGESAFLISSKPMNEKGMAIFLAHAKPIAPKRAPVNN